MSWNPDRDREATDVDALLAAFDKALTAQTMLDHLDELDADAWYADSCNGSNCPLHRYLREACKSEFSRLGNPPFEIIPGEIVIWYRPGLLETYRMPQMASNLVDYIDHQFSLNNGPGPVSVGQFRRTIEDTYRMPVD